MKYMLLLNRTQDSLPEAGSREAAELNAAYAEVTTAMAEARVLVDCGPLQPESATTTVRVRNGETLVTDGPSAEIKELLGGYTIVDCADLDEALRWAARIPAAREASVVVRPVAGLRAPV
ncbi:MAG: YciI family protein [Chloroflexi bacterium]|nr:MAG: YciI family protein [Chloroflexota bacterium]